LIGTSR